jgi:hypothetical protein
VSASPARRSFHVILRAVTTENAPSTPINIVSDQSWQSAAITPPATHSTTMPFATTRTNTSGLMLNSVLLEWRYTEAS